MVLPRRKKLVAVAIGILLGGMPLVGFNLWLAALAERQGLEDIRVSANRSIGIIEARLDQSLASLDLLAARAVDSCGPEQREVLSQVAFDSPPIKELAVLGPEGQVFCTSLDVPPDERGAVASNITTEPDVLSLDVIRFGADPATFLRLRLPLANGNSLSALVPIDLMIPLTAGQGGPFAASIRLFTPDGTFLRDGGSPFPAGAAETELLSAVASSARFGITVKATTLKAQGDNGSLWIVGSVVNGAAVFAVILFGWLLTKRPPEYPIADVARALAANEFVPYYQPIVDITSAKLLGAEVLVRWRKQDGTVIAPGGFIPLIEQSGLIVEMTKKLMVRVCEELGGAYALRPQLTVSFNLTAAHFADDAVVADVQKVFADAPIRLSQLVLELTERQPVQSMVTTRRVIAALQGLGCRVALDDVGTGHSGLSSILKLGVDIIKIDKMFIDSISDERNSATIIETLVDLARNMRMHVVAEGVENFQQVADLRARGISAAQGYLFAPPLPGSSFLTLLEAIDPLPSQSADAAALHQAGRLAG